MNRFLFLAPLFLLLLTACVPLRIGYFEVAPVIPELKNKLDQSLTLSYRTTVMDSFLMEYPSLPKVRVAEFKKTLSSAFRNTFSETFRDLSWYNNFSLEGTSLVVEYVKPVWYERAQTSNGSEIGVKVSYKVSLYKNGKWTRDIERISTGNYYLSSMAQAMTAYSALHILRGGITVMYQDLYSEVMKEMSASGISSGTGFLVSGKGYIVTCSHVIESASEIKVRGVNGDFSTEILAVVVADDKANDLAILRIDHVIADSIPFAIRTKGLETGEDVFILGYPLVQHMGQEIKLTTGIISSRSGYQGSNASYQISAQAQPGSSGSPVFDVNGNLIGVVSSKIMNAEGVTYAVKPSFINTLFDNADVMTSLPDKSRTVGFTLSGQTRTIAPFIYIISAEK